MYEYVKKYDNLILRAICLVYSENLFAMKSEFFSACVLKSRIMWY